MFLCRNKLLLLMFIVLFLMINSLRVYAQNDRSLGLAVLDLQANGISEVEALALSDMLRSSISKTILEDQDKIDGKYNLVERSQMDKIFEQFEIQDLGCTDLACAVKYGKMLNVDRIIIGSVSLVGSTYMVIARIVDVESSKTIASVDRKQMGIIDNVIGLMPVVAHELLTGERLAAPVPTMPLQTQLPQATQPTAQSELQYLSVAGNPEGASIILNKQKIGESPIDYQQVTPGRYQIRITHEGYKDHEEEIVIAPGKNEKITYKLDKRTSLRVNGSPEGASVILDGKEIGRSPIQTYYLDSGSHIVTIRKNGHLDSTEDIIAYDGKERSVEYTLTALSTISVNGKPERATVSIKNKVIGETPLENFTIPEGSYRIKVSLLGFEDYTEIVNLMPGSPSSIDYFLIPKTKKGAITRSLFFPGAGQYYAGNKGKGIMFTALEVAAIAGVVSTSLSATSSWDDYDIAEGAYKEAGRGADFTGLYQELESKHDDAMSASNLQMAMIGAAAAIYLYNIIDAFMTEPNVEVRPTFNRLNLRPEARRRYAGITAEVQF